MKTDLFKKGTCIICTLDELIYSVDMDGIQLPIDELIECFLEKLESRGEEGRLIADSIFIDELASLLDEFAVEEEEEE